MQNNPKPKKSFRDYVVFSGIAVQMGITIWLGVFLGKYLDRHFELSKKYFTISLTLLALVASIYNVIIQLKQFNEE